MVFPNRIALSINEKKARNWINLKKNVQEISQQ